MVKDLSKLAEDIKEALEKNKNKVIESPPLSKLQAERLRDNYLSNYKILGMDPINRNVPVSSYVLCITHGGNQSA